MAKFCASCGAELVGTQIFCVNCGIKQAEAAPPKTKTNKSQTAIITVCIFAVFFVGSLFAFSKVGGNAPIDSGKNNNVVSNHGSGNTTKPSGATSTTQSTNEPTQNSETNGQTTDPANPDAPNMNWSEIENGTTWPTAYLPKDMPKFTGSNSIEVNGKPGKMRMKFIGTGKSAIDSYRKTLEDAGWKLGLASNDAYTYAYAQKDGWEIQFYQYYNENGEYYEGEYSDINENADYVYAVIRFY
jgi:hypothetical protein